MIFGQRSQATGLWGLLTVIWSTPSRGANRPFPIVKEIALRFRPRRVGWQNQPADKREQENGMTSERDPTRLLGMEKNSRFRNGSESIATVHATDVMKR